MSTTDQPTEIPMTDPRVDSLRTRLARLAELDTQAALITAGTFSLAQDHGVLRDTRSSQLAAAYLAVTTAVDRLISVASLDLAAIEATHTGRATPLFTTAPEALHG